MRLRTLVALGLTLLVSTACGAGEPHVQAPLTPVRESEPDGVCGAVVRQYAGGSGAHHEECSDIQYSTSPPVFGDHYPYWAAYQSYDFPLPLGFLVHDLEHGAVVLFYDCPDGCDEEVARAKGFIAELPDDPRCASDVRVQVILVPRPGLGSRWAAAAWGWSLNAECFDASAFGEFYEAHHGRGPEDLCNQGIAYGQNPCE